jgi:AcrR family transcriptional regulator
MNDSRGGRGRQPSVFEVLRDLILHPLESIARRWNWKSALLSSSLRALIFFAANLPAGRHAAIAALLTELVFRGITSGFYGALTEAFRFAEPEWAAFLVAMILLPLTGHSLEFVVHFLRGTMKLKVSIIASVCFTAVSTLFNLYAMRRGALITGVGQQTLGSDMKRMPRLILGFLISGPRAAWRLLARRVTAVVRTPLSIRQAAGESSD